MTKEKFMESFKVSARVMNSWLERGWIRGAETLDDGTWYIPEGAIPPYSKRSTRCKGVGIYHSIIKGCAKELDVFPELYNMHPVRFNAYINQLIKSGFIEKTEKIDGITYYIALPKCLECNEMNDGQAKRFIRNTVEVLSPAIEACVKGAIEGLAS